MQGKVTSVYFKPEVAKFLESNSNVSDYINNLVLADMNSKSKDNIRQIVEEVLAEKNIGTVDTDILKNLSDFF